MEESTSEQTLTLSMDEDVIRRARRLARNRDTSLSALVEERLRHLLKGRSEFTPLVAGLRATLPEDATSETYQKYLDKKHGG